MFTEVLVELNNLNKKFQEDNLDVTLLEIVVEHALNTLKRYFYRQDYFAKDAVHLTNFKNGFLENVDRRDYP